MALTQLETEVFDSVLQGLASDLSDRGILTSTQACVLASSRIRLACEGELFYTKMLPCVGKALDAYLLADDTVDRGLHQEACEHLWCTIVPILGIDLAVQLLDGPENLDPGLVKALREVSYLFYKYEMPPTEETVRKALDTYVSIDQAIGPVDIDVSADVALFERIFRGIDLSDIHPSHGPGAVSLKETGPRKYDWTAFPERLVNTYSYDYFVASPEHLCSELGNLMALPSEEVPARVLTVPKDSRGPRVIACEPKENQWIQQGIMRRLVDWIEHHPITRGHVRFTDQTVNGRLAREGSVDGSYATLDLSEASDRVSLEYVTKAFPEWVTQYILACRSAIVSLPDGRVVTLRKFASMGSANCFPVLALTVFARLRSRGIVKCHVYGDDVIVPKHQVSLAITALEEIGLKVNRSKSCSTGLFRESCGVDAYRGIDVTPLRIKQRWSSRPRPSAYVAWISYANSLYARNYVQAAYNIAARLLRIYGAIEQSWDGGLNVPHFNFVVDSTRCPVSRTNKGTQSREYLCWTVQARPSRFTRTDAYQELEWLSKAGPSRPVSEVNTVSGDLPKQACVTSSYTRRGDVRLRKTWTQIYRVVE